MVPYKIYKFYMEQKFKMASTARKSLTCDPMAKVKTTES